MSELKHDIDNIVCNVFGISIEDLYSNKRFRDIVWARGLCYMYLRDNYSWAFYRIGNRYNKDHSNVIHIIKKLRGFISVKDSVLIKYIEDFNLKVDDDNYSIGDIGSNDSTNKRTVLNSEIVKTISFMKDNKIPNASIALFYNLPVYKIESIKSKYGRIKYVKLTENDIKVIKRMLNSGKSVKEISDKFKVSKTTIYRITNEV